MKNFILIIYFIPVFLFSQSKRDLKKYDNIINLINLNNLELAHKETLKLLEKNNEWKKLNLILSSIYWKQSKYQKSEDEYFKFYDLKSRNNNGCYQFARWCLEEGLYEKALKYFQISVNYISNLEVNGEFGGVDSKSIEEQIYFINCCKYAIIAKENPVDFKFFNMGSAINSENAEYLPFISVDGNDFIFTRLIEDHQNELQEDFYISNKNNGIWSYSNSMKINTSFNEGAISISANSYFLVYTACNRDDGKGKCDLYFCKKMDNNNWSKAENISSINSRNWESQACFSPDLKYLYFVSDRKGGYGGDDIWRSEITQFGFGKPENLGSTINTKYDEMSPFLHPDNLTFYFSSKGHIGMGDFDLFVSKRIHSDTLWQIPKNLGYPINSHKTENSLVVSSDGETAFFVSNNSGYGKEDIFYFQLPQEMRASNLSELELEIITKEIGEEIILKNVLFATDSYVLIESSFNELNSLIDYLSSNPSKKIHIEGHTDDIGEVNYNLNLSQKRAEEVFNYIINRGVDIKRISYKGYGENKPIATNNTNNGRKKNRRTSFIIY
ncbi:OmpA family protein [bacterium]|nr:OmpA family protein [bacterium]